MPQLLNRRTKSVVATPATDAWEEAVHVFLLEKRRARASEATLQNYRHNLLGSRARTWREDYGITSPADATAAALRRFEADLAEAGLSADSQHQAHRVIKNFLRFCSEEGLEIDARTLTLKAPRLPKKRPRDYTDEQIQRLFGAVENPRDRFLMTLLLRTGLRVGEAVALTLDDRIIGPEGPLIRVRWETAKGSKERTVPMDTATYRLSREWNVYVRDVRPRDTDRRELFLGRREADGERHGLTAHGVKVMLMRLGQRAGVRHTGAHRFRHTFATRFLAITDNPLQLKRILGHSTMAMVDNYVHWRDDDLVRSFARLRF
jgi:integrase/recombinase XerD